MADGKTGSDIWEELRGVIRGGAQTSTPPHGETERGAGYGEEPKATN